jgi:hypothetical protein
MATTMMTTAMFMMMITINHLDSHPINTFKSTDYHSNEPLQSCATYYAIHFWKPNDCHKSPPGEVRW